MIQVLIALIIYEDIEADWLRSFTKFLNSLKWKSRDMKQDLPEKRASVIRN